MKDGRFTTSTTTGIEKTNIAGTSALSAGKREIKYVFVPDAAKRGGGVCLVRRPAGRREPYPQTQPFVFSADEGVDVGMDGETAVSNDYKEGDNRFTGRIVKVTVDVKPFGLSAADKKAIEDAEAAAVAAEE
jgi:arylsulfatase